MFKVEKVSCEFGGRTLTIETGKMARQADGAVLVTYGETVVLVTACAQKEPKAIDFMPLTVEFQEKFYAAGRIPGGFFKREAKPSTDATLTARSIDRPIRPLFPESWRCDTQVVAQVFSVDKANDPDVVASIGASAALAISDIPFTNFTAACRVGRLDGQLIINPSPEQQEKGDIDVFIAGTKNAIMMVEGGAKIVPEAEVLDALLTGHNELKKVVAIIEELARKVGKPKREVASLPLDHDLKPRIAEFLKPLLSKALSIQEKAKRYEGFATAKAAAVAEFVKEGDEDADLKSKTISTVVEEVKYNLMRESILSTAKRIDGRGLKDIRPIEVESGILPRTHGSSLFTRGETQVLAAATLGTGDDEQMIDVMRGVYFKRFMLNYNFPPFSVGEVGRIGTPGRREIGHGALAERALFNILPPVEQLPYTVRLVCEVLESNGSSSMGSVCSGSMALMDAGVKIPAPVAGIAMGLIKEGSRVAVLSDILGDEDHLGDMDFKVAGTKDGVTAIQMDIKIEGVDEQIMRTALTQAYEGRMHILNCMSKAISEAKDTVSAFAPRFTTMQIKTDKIRDVIGSGGKTIKDIIARTGVKIDVSDDGVIKIASTDPEKAQMAEDIIKNIVAEPEVGKIYKGKIKSIVEFGAFVEIIPGTEGLLHVSEIAHERVKNVKDVLSEGQEVEVKLLEVDRGRLRLSRKALLEKPAHLANSGGGEGGGEREPRSEDDANSEKRLRMRDRNRDRGAPRGAQRDE